MLTFFLSLTLIGSWVDWVQRSCNGAKEGVYVENIPVGRMLPGELREVVSELAVRCQRLPVEPSLDKTSGAILDGREGVIVDIDQTVANALSAVPGTNVKLVQRSLPTRYNKISLQQVRYCIGAYRTGFTGSNARYRNIETACRSVNNTVVWPGQEFSFNDSTGPRTAEFGYLPAPIISGGDFGMGDGGGVCQASSTLYNAARQARLPVTERHAHSKPVHYVPAGKDAAVSFGDQNLRFVNPRSRPVIIKMWLAQGTVSAEIWGGEN